MYSFNSEYYSNRGKGTWDPKAFVAGWDYTLSQLKTQLPSIGFTAANHMILQGLTRLALSSRVRSLLLSVVLDRAKKTPPQGWGRPWEHTSRYVDTGIDLSDTTVDVGEPVNPWSTPQDPVTLAKSVKIFKLQDITGVRGDRIGGVRGMRLGAASPTGWLNPYVSLDFVPQTLEYRVDPNTRDLKIIGRNTGVYHHGGSEDTLTFQIHWFGTDNNNAETNELVIQKCRKVEALAKADGWSQGPPVVFLAWGNYQSSLFSKHLFILEKTDYVLKNFTSNRIRLNNGVLSLAPYNLHPVHAVQTVHFKRVSQEQLNMEDIVYGDL